MTVLACELLPGDGQDALDPERLHALLNRFLDLAREEIRRYEGTLNRLTQRGFIALFGAPIAHEDHAQRAALTALALQQGVQEQRADFQLPGLAPLTTRMGLDTGELVIGGTGDMAVGAALENAQQLRDSAAPGQVLVSDATGRLIESTVRLAKAGATGLPAGTSEILQGETAGDGAEPGVPLSPFVGRRRELDLLEELRELAASSHGQVVGITGEAGAGKSRLILELRKRLRGQRVSFLSGQCRSYAQSIPYLPLQDLVRRGSQVQRGDDPATIATKLRTSLEAVGSDVAQTLPYLLRLLGIQQGSESLGSLEPLTVQQRTFTAMRQMLLDASRQSLVVMVIEDFHWADATSQDFLATVVEALPATRLLLLLTYRTGYQPPWMDRSYATQIPMRRLSAEDSRTVVSTILRRAQVTEDLATGVLDKAEGNPFFLEELARSLIDQAATGTHLPNTVQGVLMARIDRLPEHHKHLLQTASVLGRELSQDLLQALWDQPADLQPLLQDLQSWEFLHRLPTSTTPSFAFRHALTQEVAYQSLLTDRRQKLHGRAAQALEQLYAGHIEDVYHRLAHHHGRAGNEEQTVHYLTLSAQQAAQSYAHQEAAAALTEALDHAQRLPEPDHDRRTLEILLQLAESLLPLARFPQTLELFEKHQPKVESLQDPSLTARFHFWLAHTHSYLGNQEAASTNAQTSIAAAQEAQDEATEGKAHYVLGRDSFWAGRYEQGLEDSLKAIVLLERTGEIWWQGQAHWVAGFHHFLLGHHQEALAEMARAHSIGEALDDYRLDTSWSTGYFYAAMGEVDKGIELCRRGMERAKDPLNTGAAMGFLGYAYLQKGELELAVENLREAVQRMESAGMRQLEAWFLVYLAATLREREQLEEGGELAAKALEISQAVRFGYGEALSQEEMSRPSAEA